MSETNNVEALAAPRRFREACHQHDWSRYAPDLQVTFSAGICQYQRGAALAQMLEDADLALYAAKAQGRDRRELALGQRPH